MGAEFQNKSEVLSSVEFAVIKEYMEAGGTDDGIASVCGISRKLVANVRKAEHYKQYMENLKLIHRQKISKDAILLESSQPKPQAPTTFNYGDGKHCATCKCFKPVKKPVVHLLRKKSDYSYCGMGYDYQIPKNKQTRELSEVTCGSCIRWSISAEQTKELLLKSTPKQSRG